MDTNKKYCLGNGAIQCDGCQQNKNWEMLNRLPETARARLQKQMTSINDDECILRGRPWYQKGSER